MLYSLVQRLYLLFQLSENSACNDVDSKTSQFSPDVVWKNKNKKLCLFYCPDQFSLDLGTKSSNRRTSLAVKRCHMNIKRPRSPTATLNWQSSKCKVHKISPKVHPLNGSDMKCGGKGAVAVGLHR